jgi:uncharacterized Zn finger protein
MHRIEIHCPVCGEELQQREDIYYRCHGCNQWFFKDEIGKFKPVPSHIVMLAEEIAHSSVAIVNNE